MTGIRMSEGQAWLNLSDGGHIENMGVYELLRRRCKYIICVDGESDPEFTFQGLMTLVRHAQIDFGIRIEGSLNDLRPDPNTKLSRTHAVLCRIHYSNSGVGRTAATGLLLYMKLSVTGNEPELIKRYRITHPDFPAPDDARPVLQRRAIRGLPPARRPCRGRPVLARPDGRRRPEDGRTMVLATRGELARTRLASTKRNLQPPATLASELRKLPRPTSAA